MGAFFVKTLAYIKKKQMFVYRRHAPKGYPLRSYIRIIERMTIHCFQINAYASIDYYFYAKSCTFQKFVVPLQPQ